jgi:hypothetical protein
MEKFMYLFRGGDANNTNKSPEAIQAHMQKWMGWMKTLGEKGILVGGEALQATGKSVSGTKKTVTDGPYVEAKEMIGGYLVVQAKDMNEAVEISKGCPILEVDGGVEVRPVQKMDMPK